MLSTLKSANQKVSKIVTAELCVIITLIAISLYVKNLKEIAIVTLIIPIYNI
jgi:hypothetical protein